jgi:hypothetical protein
MASAKPYMTSSDLVNSVKLRIAFPIDQSTFTFNDILTLANEEMLINAVPQIIEEHEEYFIYKLIVPLVPNVSRYAIPNRTLGMALRDLKYSDTNGNYLDMSRIAPEDKAFFQNNTGANQTITKYYLEGNEVVLTPQLMTNPTGNLNFFIYLRPNSLVRNDRACTILGFKKDITLVSNNFVPGDQIIITTGNESQYQTEYIFNAVSGSPVSNAQFQIGADAQTTAVNLNAAMQSQGLSTTIALNVITLNYSDVSTSFEWYLNTPSALSIDVSNLYIKFDQLPTTYTDPDTQEVSTLYSQGCLVDFLQTLPGHRTYTFDVTLQSIQSGNVGVFSVAQMQTYLNNSSGGTQSFFPILVGDYMALQNECIIPQIPPELHSALAERTASRILMAIGDRDGYAVSQQKIAEMDRKQATLIGSRVEGAVNKVFNRNNLLRCGKRNIRRRFM